MPEEINTKEYKLDKQIGSWGLASKLLDEHELENNGDTQYPLHLWITRNNSGKDVKGKNIYEKGTILIIPDSKKDNIKIIGNKLITGQKGKIKIKVIKKVTKIEGPDTIEYGSVVNPDQPTVFRKYTYKAVEFSKNVKDEDKKKIKWAVIIKGRTVNEQTADDKILKLDGTTGQQIELEVIYDYVMTSIIVIPYFPGYDLESLFSFVIHKN